PENELGCRAGEQPALSQWFALTLQAASMVGKMVGHEAADEEVTVIVAGMVTQGERLADGGAGGFKAFGLQLHVEELVVQALIDEDALRIRCSGLLRHEQTGVMRRPLVFIFAQVAAEGLVTPGAVHRIADGCESRQRLE